jgi:hypothetical protein
MASNINPDTIDGNYPVAGQDNNTQGMRDNFTNTKINFAFAAQEITALQNQSVQISNVNLLNNALLIDGRIQDFGIVRFDQIATTGNISNPIVINYASGHYQTIGPSTGNVVLSFSNFPPAGIYGIVRTQINIANTAHQIVFPAGSTIENAVGIQGYDPASKTITVPAPGVYEFTFGTYENGSEITVDETNKSLQPFNNTSEDLGDASAADTAVTTSYFSTDAAETATLAAGVEGQIKIFAMKANSGDMVITVDNAGWKNTGTGTITFDTIGDACTLQYISAKWFCIGNNGCTFA